ncbi:MAG: MprA protease, GlyGly-CTERM protein-sorting domain-containing form [Planctomycetota bacterium]
MHGFKTFTLSAAALAMTAGSASAIQIQIDADLDRWNYPFNLTPGIRDKAPTFGAVGSPVFDNRDGQLLLGFDLAGLLPALGPGQSYQINAATVTATHSTGAFQYDPTYDGYQTYLDSNDPNFVADGDAGRPIVLTGTGFRSGFFALGFGGGFPPPAAGPPTYEEDDVFAFADPTLPGVRNAFASASAGAGLVDISNNVDDAFDFTPFAVGQTNLNPGDAALEGVAGVSAGSTFSFDLNLSDPVVLGYLQQQLAFNQLGFTISSLHGTSQAGGSNPNFYTRDDFDPAAISPSLFLDIEVVPEPASAALLLAGGVAAFARRRRAS